MWVTDELLTHDHHLGQYRWALNGHEANDGYFKREATEMHMLVVVDAVTDLVSRSVQLGLSKGGGVHDHLVYGVARRCGDIRIAMREIVATAPVGRTKGMLTDEVDVVSRALNTTYINIRGTLDNLAWAMIEDTGGLKAHGLQPAEVDLFGKAFKKAEAFKPLTEALAEIAPWTKELARLRNPAAHQIPLSVVPAELNEKDQAEYNRLYGLLLAPIPEGKLDKAFFDKKREEQEAIKRQIADLGQFSGVFAHRPSEGVTPLYPTVAEDVGQMVKAARIVMPFLEPQAAAAAAPAVRA